MGTALGGGVVWDPPFNLGGGGGLGHPLPSTFLVRQFSLWREAPESFFWALSNQPKTHFGALLSCLMSKNFFGAPRQSGKRTLFIVILGKGGSKMGIWALLARSAEGKFFRQFWSEKLGFWIYGKEA